MIRPAFVDRAIETFEEDHVQVGTGIEPRYLEANRYVKGEALTIVQPSSEMDLARLIVPAAETGVRLVPHGTHLGLVLGATPNDARRDVMLGTDRLRSRFAYEELDASLCAGFRLGEINGRLEPHGVMPVVDLLSDPSVGGLRSANAGGTRKLHNGGVSADMLGLA